MTGMFRLSRSFAPSTSSRTSFCKKKPFIFNRKMGSESTINTSEKIYFGPFEVTNQVFLRTRYSFALVNLKPLLPGHVLVCPLARHKRLTDLSVVEVTDLFTSVQRVQRMLARHYFTHHSSPSSPSSPSNPSSSVPSGTTTTRAGGGGGGGAPEDGSFNIAVQDGAGAGQTVPHVHVHIIPRIPDATDKPADAPGDELYDRLAGEDGNVGGLQWDLLHGDGDGDSGGGMVGGSDDMERRPQPGGKFPPIEDRHRKPRTMQEMEAEAALFRRVLEEMEEQEEARPTKNHQ
ncbi:HIT domain-containing protein [Diplogelasinospora grovesii]|uniref:Bis(5'-adenosyl)-triphosphatase n=1 Tax=Diplogelasinospora grovesii TaxID=303347 RepID=A0AAN6NEY5_9PEZI|nr:HIT domain-containing protein [Diplogelasinospora grovesii]